MRYLLLIGCIFLITACGSGGSSTTPKEEPVPKEIIPPEQRWDNVTWGEMVWR